MSLKGNLTISLVAIAISMISLILVFNSDNNLQTDLRQLTNSEVNQSDQVALLKSQLGQSQQVIEEQVNNMTQMRSTMYSMNNTIKSEDDKIMNLTNQISSLNNRVTSLENNHQVVLPPPPIPNEPKYLPETITDSNGNSWTSHYIKESLYYSGDDGLGCNVPQADCYVHISKINTQYGSGAEVDTINSTDSAYWEIAYSQEFTASPGGKVTVSGWFLKNDTLNITGMSQNILDGTPGPTGIGFGYSILGVLLLSEDPDNVIKEQVVLKNNDTKGIWIYKQTTFTLDPGQTFRIGIGRPNDWASDYNLYASWSDVVINTS